MYFTNNQLNRYVVYQLPLMQWAQYQSTPAVRLNVITHLSFCSSILKFEHNSFRRRYSKKKKTPSSSQHVLCYLMFATVHFIQQIFVFLCAEHILVGPVAYCGKLTLSFGVSIHCKECFCVLMLLLMFLVFFVAFIWKQGLIVCTVNDDDDEQM